MFSEKGEKVCSTQPVTFYEPILFTLFDLFFRFSAQVQLFAWKSAKSHAYSEKSLICAIRREATPFRQF